MIKLKSIFISGKMKLNDIINYIDELVQNHFVKDENNDKLTTLLELDGNDLNKSIIRLKRINKESLRFYRAFLLVELNEPKYLNEALQWTAAVKSSLTDPETSDLYLIIVSKENVFSESESMRIEATEQFCKKYVQRGSEPPKDLIKRTNLAIISSISGDVIQTDPVDNALLKTQEEHNWFDEDIQKIWKTSLRSEKSGNELLDLLK